jgi:hypothetical protein
VAVVSVFVSSTFRDFHGERDALAGPVRAVLDELVRPMGCRVEMIDLRWGVAAGHRGLDYDARQRRVLDVCLSEISRSRPLFVGLVGDRYGWVPPSARAQRVAREAGLPVDVADRSMTELEFLHGALAQTETVTPVVFLRALTGEIPPGWRDTDTSALRRLGGLRRLVDNDPGVAIHRYEVHADGVRIPDLSGFEALAVHVLAPLVVTRARALAEDHGEADPVVAAESLFFADRTAVISGRVDLLEQLAGRIGEGRSVCLIGPSGFGKSALWCSTVQRLRRTSVPLAAVPVGAAPGITSERIVISRLAAQLGASIPADVNSAEGLHDWWRDLLTTAAPVVIAVDALDSLDAGAARDGLRLLTGLPAGVTRLAATTSERQAALLRRVGVESVRVGELDAPAVALAARDLVAALRRELPREAVRVLASQPRSPLWLTLAIGELTALDEDDFTGVDPAADPVAELARLVTATVTTLPEDAVDVVGVIAERAERRYGLSAVQAVLRPLAASRSGLAPSDLSAVTGLSDVVIAGVRRAFAGWSSPEGQAAVGVSPTP